MFTLLGYPLTTLTLLGAAALVATVVLYILRLHRRPVPVPFSPIWQRVLRDKQATHWFARLKRLLSLLLQVMLLALLIAALGDPRLAQSVTRGRNLVVLVDASASMKARDLPPSRMEAARVELKKLVSGLSGADRMLIAQMDANLTPLSTLTSEVSDLNDAADALQATDTAADLERGLRFAQDALRGLPHPEVIILSDGGLGDTEGIAARVPLGDVPVRYMPLGKSSSNVAITAFSVRRYPLDKSRHEVMLEVLNTTQAQVQVELTLWGDGQVVDVSTLRLEPQERLPRFYQDLAGASRVLEATIRAVSGATDDLPADDRAYALMPERQLVRVLVVSSGNTYLEAALLLDEYLQVQQVTPEEYPVPDAADVTIFDGVAPKVVLPQHGSLLYLNPPAEGAPVERGRQIQDFGFDLWERKSPLLRWMALDHVQVATGYALVPGVGDTAVAKSDLGTLLVEGTREGRRFVALGFDPRDSDFVLRVAWPLFVLNAINTFVEEDSGYISSFRTGEVWGLKTKTDAPSVTLVAPSQTRTVLPVQGGQAAFFGAQAGIYRIEEPGGIGTAFAANLSAPSESYIEPRKQLTLGSTVATDVSGFHTGVRNEIWLYLVLAAVGLSVVEWLTYHRRITV